MGRLTLSVCASERLIRTSRIKNVDVFILCSPNNFNGPSPHKVQRGLSFRNIPVRHCIVHSTFPNNPFQPQMFSLGLGLTVTDAVVTDVIRHENESLRQDIAAMAGQMKQTTQLQELANMLQDSHK